MKKNPENMTRGEIEAELAAGLGEERLVTVAKMRREKALRDALYWFDYRATEKLQDKREAERTAIVTLPEIEGVLTPKEPS